MECIELYDEELMKEALDLAELAEIPKDDPDVAKVHAGLKHIEEERKLIEEFENDHPKGAWLQTADDVTTEPLETLSHKSAKFEFRTAKGKYLVELTKRLITLRTYTAIKIAVDKDTDESWNSLRNVIATIVSEEETMKENHYQLYNKHDKCKEHRWMTMK